MTKNSKKSIPVLVSGALGKMGSEVVNSVLNSSDCELVAAIDTNKKNNGENISQLLNLKKSDVFVSNDLEGSLCSISQDYRNEEIKPVLVDFTHPDSVYENTRSAIAYGISPVVGTTGLTPSQINDLAIFTQKANIGCAIIPNFSVGMVLLQQAASVAAKFYDNIELIEMHHNQK
ncbi:MAG: 4-hydroxy-tetrahydrodipicolinate reductase, partial [Prochlorococcus sp. MED105]|nr:4-hydroxy-tetrahydrodipicolinate reductase [Prochlorococcus sp. MED105]